MTADMTVSSVVDADAFATWFGMLTPSGRTEFADQLAKWESRPDALTAKSALFTRFQRAYQQDPTFYPTCRTHFDAVAALEPSLCLLTEDTLSDAEKESYSELLFFGSICKPLNFIPLFMQLWATVRVYLLPGMAILFPLLTLLAPYILLRFIFKLPITLGSYTHLLQSMISGNVGAIFSNGEGGFAAPAAGPGQGMSPIAIAKQASVVLITLVQGIVQPYWSFQHLRRIDGLLTTHGDSVLALYDHYQALATSLETHGITFFRCPLPPLPSSRVAAAQAMLNSTYLRLALRYVGRLEVLMTLAQHPDMCPVRWVRSATPVFRIRDTYDFQVDRATRHAASATLDRVQGTHALLTGPNKGGKSTVLRALSISALLAHTYGCAIGSLTATPFSKMFVCLKPDDLPGSKSRFEREIEFTASTLRVGSKPILVFIDELYHSTNPPDALRSCEIYSAQLWKMSNVASIISTHLFDWVEKAPETIQRLCCPADRDPETGEVRFSYQLAHGVCTVSSVDTLLRKNGLSCA